MLKLIIRIEVRRVYKRGDILGDRRLGGCYSLPTEKEEQRIANKRAKRKARKLAKKEIV